MQLKNKKRDKMTKFEGDSRYTIDELLDDVEIGEVSQPAAEGTGNHTPERSPRRRKKTLLVVATVTLAVIALGLGLGFGLSGSGGGDGTTEMGAPSVGAEAEEIHVSSIVAQTIEAEETGTKQNDAVSDTYKYPETDVTDGDDVLPYVVPGKESEGIADEGTKVNAVEEDHQKHVGVDPETNEDEAQLEPEQYYTSPPSDPIPVKLRQISPSIMSGYQLGSEGCADLYADIYNASAILANEVIKRNAEGRCRPYYYYSDGDRGPSDELMSEDASDLKGNAPALGEGTSSSNQEDAYESNNQEVGVDEADILKSNGKHVFAAYGDILVIWDATTGKERSRTIMPPKKVLSVEEGGHEYKNHYNRKPRISGLLLHSKSNRLVVIVSGNMPSYRYDYLDRPILQSRGDVHVRLYDISSIPTNGSELPLLSFMELWGSYRSARSINDIAHVVVQSSIESHSRISDKLYRCLAEYDGLNKEEYIAVATENAKELLHRFSSRLVEELKIISGGKSCSAVTRVTLYASGGDAENDDDGWPEMITSGGILKSYLQVSSFDMSANPDAESLALKAKTAGSFSPSLYSEIYASKDVLIASGRGYHRNTFSRTWAQSTYFLSFKLNSDGSAPSGLAIGRAPGYVLNQFSMDEYKNYFRVATTSNAQWGCVEPELTEKEEQTAPSWRYCNWKRISDSKSQLIVMKFPEVNGSGKTREMKTIKVIEDLGVTEIIRSVRFFNEKAYIVTFMRTDPLYSIDFSDPENPKVTDELKITGYSSYLHPIGPDRLLAIGREANEKTGRVTGFQITLFDVSDLTNANVLQRYTLDHKGASSSAERDHLAFRYLPKSKLLILPLKKHSYNNNKKQFDGFKVYYVDDNKIEKRFGLSMTNSYNINYGCWYDAYLPARSMVFSGNLTVVKGHGYASYNLDTEEKRWKRNLDKDVPKNNCNWYWR